MLIGFKEIKNQQIHNGFLIKNGQGIAWVNYI